MDFALRAGQLLVDGAIEVNIVLDQRTSRFKEASVIFLIGRVIADIASSSRPTGLVRIRCGFDNSYNNNTFGNRVVAIVVVTGCSLQTFKECLIFCQYSILVWIATRSSFVRG